MSSFLSGNITCITTSSKKLFAIILPAKTQEILSGTSFISCRVDWKPYVFAEQDLTENTWKLNGDMWLSTDQKFLIFSIPGIPFLLALDREHYSLFRQSEKS